MSEKKWILILCTGNLACSQMAEGLLKHICQNEFEIFSARTKSSIVRPDAIKVLAEIGIDISKIARSQLMNLPIKILIMF